ncbi:ring canal kelch protein [Danaus plexippus plexippus]|uniref:Ring canal kelch protein n=1 Tax=Danaus plexippus plexippus TaxID=278856 RepID=A0A212EIT2_DANPL|nr:ring canal kelch protein [Danaus plexippus plexippus]
MQEVRDVVREELKVVFDIYRKDMLEQIENKFQKVLDNMAAINTSIEFLERKYEDVKQEMDLKFESIKNLEQENNRLRTDVNDLQSRLSLMEQQSRACIVEVQCVPEFKNENLITTLNEIASVINCELDKKTL